MRRAKAVPGFEALEAEDIDTSLRQPPQRG
jgi:hypothetical protein